MGKVNLTKKEVKQLLATIKNDEDRKAIRLYLLAIDEKPGHRARQAFSKREKVSRLLDVLVRMGLKLGETVVIEKLIRHLLD